jgi:hypothetical protein
VKKNTIALHDQIPAHFTRGGFQLSYTRCKFKVIHLNGPEVNADKYRSSLLLGCDFQHPCPNHSTPTEIERRISVPLGIMLGTSLSSQLIRLLEIASLHGDNDH